MVDKSMMQMLTEDEAINKDTFIQLFEEIFNAGVLCCENSNGYPILSAEGNLPDILGYRTEEELIEKNKYFGSLIMEDDLSSVLEVLNEVLSGKNSFSIEFRGRKNDGKAVWLHGVIVYLKNTGHILFSFIKAVESLWNRIFRLLPCGICRVAYDEVFTILQANEIYYDIYGYTSKEAINAGFTNEKFIIYPDDFQIVHEEVENYLKAADNCIFEMEHRIIRKNQQVGWVLVKAYIDRTAQGDYLNCVLLDISDRKKSEEALRISEEQTRIAFLSTDNDMEIYNVRTHVLECPYGNKDEPECPCLTQNVPYSIIAKGLVEGDSIRDYMNFFTSIMNGAPKGRCTVQMKKENEKAFRWYEMKYHMIFDNSGIPERAVLSYKDITTQREKEMAYEKWSHFFDLQKENSLGYYEYNLTKNIYAGNEDELCHILPDYIRSFTEAVTYFFETYIYEPDKEKYLAFYNRERLLAEYYSGKKNDYIEYRRKRDTGEIFWASGTVQLISDPYTEDIRVFILVQDIDKEKQHQLKLKNQIENDSLTGLLNRGTVIKKIKQRLEQKENARSSLLIMIDVDRFKGINDNFGHQFGDQTLSDIGQKISLNAKAGDLCGRLGGDEFILLLSDIYSLEQAYETLQELSVSLKLIYENGVTVSVSLGAVYPCDEQTFEALYNEADRALYRAKKRGRNLYEIAAPSFKGV